MRVCAVLPLYPPYSLVGAWIATHRHLAYLASLGHEVNVYAFLATKRQWEIDGVHVYGHEANSDELARRADVIIGHAGDGVRSHRIAHRHRRPLVHMFHGLPAAPSPDASVVVFNSETSREHCRNWRGDSVVCPPWTDPAAHHVETTGDHVTLVNCSIEKGVNTAWVISERLPDLPFLGVLGGYGDQKRGSDWSRMRNVTIWPIQSDMRNVWRQTRILLMPSLRESWGMVGVEALASGIPVICTDLPGPREALGDAATFLPRDDIDAWTVEIRRLNDPQEWASASARAFARSAELAANDSRQLFAEAVLRYARPKAVVA